ncbi:hypothetical protein [Leptospira santarosai]|uniref:hypothetical protein n=1 Tax=Leptospira santarosai TaxID=28183 RepID=UPI000773A6DE|nr:hypothetical protein [Leptospira santarosai]
MNIEKYELRESGLPSFWIENWDASGFSFEWKIFHSSISICILIAFEEKDFSDFDKNFINIKNLIKDQSLELLGWFSAKGFKLPLIVVIQSAESMMASLKQVAGDQEWLRSLFSIIVCKTDEVKNQILFELLNDGFLETLEVYPKDDRKIADEILSKLNARDKIQDSGRRSLLLRIQSALLKSNPLEDLAQWEAELIADYKKILEGAHESNS